jgi:molybdopterin-containing oxidoreductase family iron-sulfur binding subunit
MSGQRIGQEMNGTEKTAGKSVGKAVENESNNAAAPMTLAAVREELKGAKGKKYWRSVDELADTPEFQAAVEKEFPSAVQEWVDPVSRRGFMKLMGASLALAGLAGCTKQPDDLPLRQGARRFDPRQADVLCHGASLRHRRGAAAGEERPVPAHQD